MKRKPIEPPPLRQHAASDFSIGIDLWEFAVFDSAKLFTVVTSRGRGTRERHEFDNAIEAIAFERLTPRSCAYAVSPQGRHAMLVPDRYNMYIERWNALHTRPRKRPITK